MNFFIFVHMKISQFRIIFYMMFQSITRLGDKSSIRWEISEKIKKKNSYNRIELQLLISNSHRKPFIHRKQSWRFEIVINEIYNIIDFYSIFKLKSKTKGSIDIGLGFKSLNFVCQFWIISSRHFFNNQMVWFLFPRTFFLIPRGNFFIPPSQR